MPMTVTIASPMIGHRRLIGVIDGRVFVLLIRESRLRHRGSGGHRAQHEGDEK